MASSMSYWLNESVRREEMSRITHGMDPAEVRLLAGQLRDEARKIDDLAGRLGIQVGRASWEGADARRFKDDWWPGHRRGLLAIVNELREFANSADKNAQEQEAASGAGTANAPVFKPPGLRGPLPIKVPVFSVPPGEAAPTPGQTGTPGQVGATSGELPDSHRTWQEADEAFRTNGPHLNLDADKRPGADNQYQCTSWVEYRWRELGVKGDIIRGDGWEKAGNNGGSVDTPPTLGAMASYGRPNSGAGHVMIVEEIRTSADGATQIRVSEFNYDGKNNAEAFRCNSVYTRNADGTWNGPDGKNKGLISFAGLPTS